jgi:hypothetical protein
MLLPNAGEVRLSPSAWLRLGLSLLLGSGCTAFDGIEPSFGGASSTGGSSSESSGGPGGAAPRGLLPLLDAANVCSLIQRCPTLGGSILLSTGLPLVQTDANANPTVRNFSSCIDWLNAPLEAGHPGFDGLRDLLVDVATATRCEDADALLPRVKATAAVCSRGEVCTDAATAVACPDAVLSNCGRGLFAPGSTCLAQTHAACAVGECTGAEVLCDEPYAFRCVDGLREGLDCSLYGLSCEPGLGCIGSLGSAVCESVGEQLCSGDASRLRVCAGALGAEAASNAEFDCAAMGRTCIEEGLTGRCAAPKESCSPYDPDQNVCTEDRISLCVSGERLDFDCSSLGKGCLPGSADGATSGHCQ